MLHSVILSAALLINGGDDTKAVYKASATESKVEWVAKKVTGQHNGVVTLKEGAFEYDKGQLTGGSFTIDMTSITVLDLEGEWKTKLEGHLKSDDFFGVTTYPTASFVIAKVVPQGPGFYKVIGNMTIKGITQEIQFPATVEEKDGKVIGKATLTLDRSKYNVRYGSGSFFDDLGDKTIYDDFDLTVSIVASK